VGKKSLEKPSAISKLQEEKLAKNNSSTPPTAGKKALKKHSSAISKQQEKEIVVNKTSKRPHNVACSLKHRRHRFTTHVSDIGFTVTGLVLVPFTKVPCEPREIVIFT
jgi:hypothetical protein